MEDLLQLVTKIRDIGSRVHWKRQRALIPLRLVVFFQLRPSARDRKAIFVEQFLNFYNRLNIALAIHPLSGAALDWLELGKFGFPEPKHIRGQTA